MKILSAEFLKSAVEPAGWPEGDLPEIAFVGRSNVGKSSMLNRLVNRKGLARVSNTPGRTRLLNFFEITIERGGTKQKLRFCDLPGYGFAKVSKTERAAWAEMIEEYLREREGLRGVVTILDSRLEPTDEDMEMIGWLAEAGRRAIPIATKIDKFAKARRAVQLRKIEVALGFPPHTLVGFSAVEGLGRDDVWAKLLDAAYGS